ncbi:hypothetical protein WH243_14670 [Acinetobacter sp. MYb177]|uniref:hypothetical protein n=1 Tax=unclassified Acinetobacter TaxID=196816 RepID=UPI000A33BCB6|nr:hypothetical protein [Acinetobacter sp. ANC 4654]OTG95075.1 hypothetical protein B9T24_09990 [Acinetobacter sp. ANC 4654]
MEAIILEAFKESNGQFQLVFEEKPKDADLSPLNFTRTKLNQVTGEVEKEIFYLHHIDRDDVRYLIYYNGKIDGTEVEELEKGLTRYIEKNAN